MLKLRSRFLSIRYSKAGVDIRMHIQIDRKEFYSETEYLRNNKIVQKMTEIWSKTALTNAKELQFKKNK